MTSSDITGAVWRRSSRSQNNGQCVEIAFLADGRVALRDSKGGETGPALVFPFAEWAAFESGLAGDEFGRV